MTELYCKTCEEVIDSDIESGHSHELGDDGVEVGDDRDSDPSQDGQEQPESGGEQSDMAGEQSDSDGDQSGSDGAESDGVPEQQSGASAGSGVGEKSLPTARQQLDSEEFEELAEEREEKLDTDSDSDGLEMDSLDRDDRETVQETAEVLEKAVDSNPFAQLSDRDATGDLSHERISSVENRANKLKSLIEDEFRQRERTQVRHGRRHGQFDSNRMISADRGSAKVFKSEDTPDEPDMHVVIVLDESGSMGTLTGRNEPIRPATDACGILVHALEANGIDVDVIRFGGRAYPAKTHTESWEDAQESILDESCGGGTNLVSALDPAQELLDHREADDGLLMVITDGLPNESELCKDHIDGFTVPTMSLQIMEDSDEFRGTYDQLRIVSDLNEITGQLEGMFRSQVLR